MTTGAARYWNGRGWTNLVAWGGTTLKDSTPIAEVDRRDAADHDATVLAYLDDAIARGIVDAEVAAAVREDLRHQARGGSVSHVAAPVTQTPTTRPATRPVSWPAPSPVSTAPLPERAPVPEPVPVAPGRLAAWWSEARQTIGSDLALHGLAYLGVLLLFAGVTGLIVFSFGDVAPWVRTVTELMVPTSLFLCAWYLSSRGARMVGDALELLGGAVTPVVVAAAFTDGSPIPPDVNGRILPLVQGCATALVAVAMAYAVQRRPSSPLRFVVAPILWLSAGLAAGAVRATVPTGDESARPDAFQLAVVLVAIALTMLALTRRRATGPLSAATATVALPATGVIYVLELVLAGAEGWPIASTIAAGLAALFALEASTTRLSAAAVGGLQSTVVIVTAMRLSAVREPQWIAVGTVIVLLALAEYIGRRRPDVVALAIGLAATAASLLTTLLEPATAAVGFGVLAIWGLWRYLVPAEWLPARDTYGVVPAIGFAVTAGAIWQMVDPGVALVATASVVCLLALLGRVWRRLAADALWVWFVPASAGAVWVASFAYDWDTFAVEVGIAGLLVAFAAALSALPGAVRVWSGSAALGWALASFAYAADVSPNVRAIGLAAAAFLLVISSLARARPLCAHFAAVGHLAGLLALAAVAWPGWPATVVAAFAAAGWWATTLVDDRGEAVQLAALRRSSARPPESNPDAVDSVAELAGLVALALTVLVAGSIPPAVDPAVDPSWVAAACGAGALVGGTVVRVVRSRRPRRGVFEWATFVTAVTAASVAIWEAGSDRNDWSAIVATVIGLAVIAMVTAPRPLTFVWTAWIATAAVTLLVGDRLGLERAFLDTLLTAWGAVVLLGAVGVRRRRHGPTSQSRIGLEQIGADRPLLAVIVLGTIGFARGGMSALAEGNETTIGWTAAAMASAVLAIALLVPLGAIAAIAEGLAVLAYALLAPWNPIERPTTFVPVVVVLLVAALLTRSSRDWWPGRWDLPLFWVAHAVGGTALVLSVDADTMTATFGSLAAVALAITLVLRRPEWAILSAALALVAGADAGPGWLALVLLIEGVLLTMIGLRRTAATSWVLLGTGAVALVGSWFDFVNWLDWSAGTIVQITVPVAAAVAFVAALGLGRVSVALAITWAGTGAVVSLGTMAVGLDEVARRSGGLTFAGSVLVLAGTAAALTPVLGPAMRWAAAGTAAAAWLPAVWALEPSTVTVTLIGTTVALVGLATALAMHGLQPQHQWIAPLSLYAVVTQGLAAIPAVNALPEDAMAVVVLSAAAAELVVLGVIAARPELFVVSPVAACAAWVIAARDTLTGEPNWFAVPIGVTLLVMVGLVRWIRRGRGQEVTGSDVITLEFVGMTIVVASPLAQLLAGELWNAIVAVTLGVLLANWGAMTRVRRRAAFGAATVLLSTLLVIGVPLSTAVTWHGPALWIALGLIGIAAIVVASTLERSRNTMLQIGRELDAMTEGWERIPRRHGPGHGPPAATSGGASTHGAGPVP